MSALGRVEIELICDAPLRIGGIGADVWRDSSGRPCVPATTLKGGARLETERLAASLNLPVCAGRVPCELSEMTPPCAVCALFGNRRSEGHIYFADLITDTEPVLIEYKHLAHSRARGVVINVDTARQPRRVLALPAGTQCTGAIRHRVPEAENWQLALFVLGLRGIAQIGARNGTGWGTCRVNVRNASLNTLAAALQARTG